MVGRFTIAAAAFLATTACENSGGVSPAPRSDLPLQTVSDLVRKPALRAEVEGICEAWKGSRQPPMRWPAVVIENCNRADIAKMQVIREADRAKLRKEMGI